LLFPHGLIAQRIARDSPIANDSNPALSRDILKVVRRRRRAFACEARLVGRLIATPDHIPADAGNAEGALLHRRA